jgi:hypothetical protein
MMSCTKKYYYGNYSLVTVGFFLLVLLCSNTGLKPEGIRNFSANQTNDSSIIKTKVWKGKSKQESKRNVKYSYPANWNTQFLDSLGCVKLSPDSCFEQFKITCFAPGKYPFTAVEIRQKDIPVNDLQKYCKNKMNEIKNYDSGKILFYETKMGKKGLLWIDMAYEWKDATGKLIYRDYVRHLLRGKVVYEIAYGSRGKEFYSYLSEGLFILKSVIIE